MGHPGAGGRRGLAGCRLQGGSWRGWGAAGKLRGAPGHGSAFPSLGHGKSTAGPGSSCTVSIVGSWVIPCCPPSPAVPPSSCPEVGQCCQGFCWVAPEESPPPAQLPPVPHLVAHPCSGHQMVMSRLDQPGALGRPVPGSCRAEGQPPCRHPPEEGLASGAWVGGAPWAPCCAHTLLSLTHEQEMPPRAGTHLPGPVATYLTRRR